MDYASESLNPVRQKPKEVEKMVTKLTRGAKVVEKSLVMVLDLDAKILENLNHVLKAVEMKPANQIPGVRVAEKSKEMARGKIDSS